MGFDQGHTRQSSDPREKRRQVIVQKLTINRLEKVRAA
jgi:hypothetical protein